MAMSTPPVSLRFPATTISNTDSSISSKVGKAIHSPSRSASLTAPMGPRNGMALTVSAADAALRAGTSYGLTRSAAMIVATTWVSQR